MIELLNREGLTRVDAIKLDVEGAEDLMLDPFFRDAPPPSTLRSSSSPMCRNRGRPTW